MPPFVIFEIDGGVTLLQSAANLREAKARMKRIAAAKSGTYAVVTQRPFKKKRIFLIGYDRKTLDARTNLLRRFGHDVRSALGNAAAIAALHSIRKIDLFVIDYKAPEQTRREMVAWLRANFPKAKVVSLSAGPRRIWNADYNVTSNKYESLSLAALAAVS